MKLFVGLGNPGREYEFTRHNIGFMIVDAFASHHRTTFSSGKGEYNVATIKLESEDIVLLKPATFMNLSGRAVVHALGWFKIAIEDLVVITDDVNLELGMLRLRTQGSDGGHNGLKSITELTGTDQVARLRCGVGKDFRPGQMADYVLSSFKEHEKKAVEEMTSRGVETLDHIARRGVERTMMALNRKQKE